MLLTKEQINKAHKVNYIDEEVPEWGGSVRIRELSAKQRDAYDAEAFKMVPDGKGGQKVVADKDAIANSSLRLLSRALVDEEMNPIFTIDELGEKSSKVCSRLAEVATKINGIDRDAIDVAEKN